MRSKIAELESINLQLTQRANTLADNLSEEGAAYRAQVAEIYQLDKLVSSFS